mgnify:CR=1 FL=1
MNIHDLQNIKSCPVCNNSNLQQLSFSTEFVKVCDQSNHQFYYKPREPFVRIILNHKLTLYIQSQTGNNIPMLHIITATHEIVQLNINILYNSNDLSHLLNKINNILIFQ